jgi:hypothetical protein
VEKLRGKAENSPKTASKQDDVDEKTGVLGRFIREKSHRQMVNLEPTVSDARTVGQRSRSVSSVQLGEQPQNF